MGEYKAEADLAAKLKEKFTEFNTNPDATISRTKLQSVLSALDPTFTQEELDTLFEEADKNQNGVIEYNEFIDFVCFLSDTGVPPAGAVADVIPEAKLSEKSKLLDIEAWKKAAQGSGSWGFSSDKQAGAIRKIVLDFPDLEAESPEGFTLAEEFVLLWQDEAGKLAEYTYFGSDEPYHNALFGALLLGLRARNLLTFVERKCRHLGKYFLPKLSGEAPSDFPVLTAVYNELAAKPDQSLKMWFEAKSGKWGQDGTTKLVLKGLEEKGVLEEGVMADVFSECTFPLKGGHQDRKDALLKRLQDVIDGNREKDSRSLAMLALCRSVDMRNPEEPDVMLEHIVGKEKCAEASKKVEELVSSEMKFSGVNVEMLNEMIDALPREMQAELESEKFAQDAYAQFSEIDVDGTGKLERKELSVAAKKCLPQKLADELLLDEKSFVDLVSMFDADGDSHIDKDEFLGFVMWCKAMSSVALQ